MKKIILVLTGAMALCFYLTGCKSNEEQQTDNTNSSPLEAQMPYEEQSGRVVLTTPGNGMVTDGNGIIGDEDDMITRIDQPSDTPADKVGDTLNHAADNIGDTVSNITHNAGNIVSNVADNVGNTVSNIADNAGDMVKDPTGQSDNSKDW